MLLASTSNSCKKGINLCGFKPCFSFYPPRPKIDLSRAEPWRLFPVLVSTSKTRYVVNSALQPGGGNHSQTTSKHTFFLAPVEKFQGFTFYSTHIPCVLSYSSCIPRTNRALLSTACRPTSQDTTVRSRFDQGRAPPTTTGDHAHTVDCLCARRESFLFEISFVFDLSTGQ